MNYPSRGTVGVAVVTAAGYAALALGALPVPGYHSFAAGLALPLALLFGPVVGWGLAAGVILTALGRGSLAPVTLALLASVLVLALLGPHFAARFGPTLGRPADRSARTLAGYGLVVLVATSAAAATLGWAFELLGAGPFHLVAGPAFLGLLGSSLLCGVPLFALAARFGDRLPLAERPPTTAHPSGRVLLGALVAPAWLLAGTVASVGFRVGQSLLPTTFTSRGLDFLLVVLDPALVGGGGRRVQVVLGAVSLVAIAALVRATPGAESAATRSSDPAPEHDVGVSSR
jgi:hypothetical protein